MTKTNFSHSATAETIDLYLTFNPKSKSSTLSPEKERELIIAAQQCDHRDNKYSRELVSHVVKRCLYLAVGSCQNIMFQTDFLNKAVDCVYTAIETYDLSQTVRLMSWAEPKIRGAFKRMTEENEFVHIPENQRALCSKYCKQVMGEGKSREQFAKDNHISLKATKEIERLVACGSNRYCDIENQKGASSVSFDPLRDHDRNVIKQQIIEAAPKILLAKAEVFLMCMGIGIGIEEPMKCDEIAQKTGMRIDTVQRQWLRCREDLSKTENLQFAHKVREYLQLQMTA